MSIFPDLYIYSKSLIVEKVKGNAGIYPLSLSLSLHLSLSLSLSL